MRAFKSVVGVSCVALALVGMATADEQVAAVPALRGAQVPAAAAEDVSEGLTGLELLHGIRAILGADPNLPADQVIYKPFMGSFSTIKNESDAALATTGYCLTDNACGHYDAYSSTSVPLSDLSCDKFCYVDKQSKVYVESQKYTVQNPPKDYLCCGWEVCH